MRVLVERALRGVVVLVLAVMLWQSLRDPTTASESVNARDGGVTDALAKWSAAAKSQGRIHVQLDNLLSPQDRAWLRALAGAGSGMTWKGEIPSGVIDAQPVASPSGRTRVLVGAPRGSSIVMSDDIGTIDTLRVQNANAAIALNSIAGNVSARANGMTATTRQRDSVLVRRVLVIGEAGWESKFVIAALEEEGWNVDAFIRVAPAVDVRQGSPAVIDTSRYSAVVALDGAAAPYADRIVGFVRGGGGVVVAPRAATLDALASLRAGSVGRPGAESRAIQTAPVNLATLPFVPIASLRSDAVPLERHSGAVATAARRISSGRAVQIGHEDTWRWRMAGGDAAVRDHRLWWSGLVSSVAYAANVPRLTVPAATDEAPMIGLVAAIGPRATSGYTVPLSGQSSDWAAFLFALLALAILGETGSRRLRGAS